MTHLFLMNKITSDWLEVLAQYFSTEEFLRL